MSKKQKEKPLQLPKQPKSPKTSTKKAAKKSVSNGKSAKKAKKKSIQFTIIAFIAALSCTSIIALLINTFNITKINKASEYISTECLDNVIVIDSISRNFQTLQKILYAHTCALTESQMNILENEMAQLQEETTNYVQTLEKHLTDENEKAMLITFNMQFEDYIEGYNFCVTYNHKAYNYNIQAKEAAKLNLTAAVVRESAEEISSVTEETAKTVEDYEYLSNKASETAINLAWGTLDDIANRMEGQINEFRNNRINDVDNAITAQNSQFRYSLIIAIIVITMIIILAMLIIFLTMRSVTKPLGDAVTSLTRFTDDIKAGNADLSTRIPIRSNDEIGALITGVNMFIEILQNIITQIVTESNQLNNAVSGVSSNIDEASDSSSDISKNVNRLASGMDSISNTLVSLNQNTSEIGDHANTISTSTDSMLAYSNEMQQRAGEMMESAIANKNTTTEIVSQIGTDLEHAIHESHKVEQVNELSDEILSIASQTNLLALNASIEAARAGDAGKGFAVVADEIRMLADSSRETANNIQNINKLVNEAVLHLSDSAKKILDYINTTILGDYEKFVQNGSQYSEDANYVKDLMEDFSQKSDRLTETTHDMINSLHSISDSITENAEDINNVSTNINSFVTNMESIQDEINGVDRIVEALQAQADRFK